MTCPVGQNLRDHPSATVLLRVPGERPDVQAPAIQVGLRYTSRAPIYATTCRSLYSDDQRTSTGSVVINDDANYLGISCSLQLALGAGELRLTSADPHVQPLLDYNYLTDPLIASACASRPIGGPRPRSSVQNLVIERVLPTDADLARMTPWMTG
jgi:hypothetical protein